MAVIWVQNPLWQVRGPACRLWEAAPSHEPAQPVALALASGLNVARQVERQASEVPQPEVLGLAFLGTGALLLLGPQSSLVDVGWHMGVSGGSSGPAHCICGGQSKTLVADGPQEPRRENAVTCSCDGLHPWPAKPQLTCLSNGLTALPPASPYLTYYSFLSQPTGRSEKPKPFFQDFRPFLPPLFAPYPRKRILVLV